MSSRPRIGISTTAPERMAPAPGVEIRRGEPITAPPTQGITLRALLIGLLLIPVVCIWNEYTEIVAEGTDLVAMSLIIAVVVLLFLLVLGNMLLKRWWPSKAFSQAELLYIYVMLTVSVGISGIGMGQFLIVTLGNLFYYATPENRWGRYWEFVPQWLVPDRAVLRGFYAGQSSFYTWAHFVGWLGPALVWTLFICMLLFCMLCMNAILRKQWIDRERLTFPIVAVPLELTRDGGPAELFRNRSFWIAFMIPVVLQSLASLNFLYPNVPFVPIKPGQALEIGGFFSSPPWNAVGYLTLAFYPLVIGIGYFLSLEVSFSCWFFYLFTKVQNVAVTALGYRDPNSGPVAQRLPYLVEQGTGAFLGLAFFSLWTGRRQIVEVLRKAFRGDPRVHDDNEPMPYRVAVFGLLGGLIGLCGFLMLAGMTWYLPLIFFVLYFMMITAFTRIRAEAGVAWGFGPNMPPHRFMATGLGSSGWNIRDLTLFSYLQWFDLDYRCVAMPHQLEAMKIVQSARMRNRQLVWLIMLATVVGCLASFWALLVIYYTYGASTSKVNGWRTGMGSVPFHNLVDWVRNPRPTDYVALRAVSIGVVVTGILTLLRTQFVWWPLHPVGYAVANTFTMDWLWCATFVGWAVKLVTLRYGGMRLYRQLIPFFIGLILGDYIIGGAWSLIGLAFGIRVYRTFPI
jgi:hypothetical protein